jgi:3-phenylpropionate/trans-cinnamate dioxygenase ferredoxin component
MTEPTWPNDSSAYRPARVEDVVAGTPLGVVVAGEEIVVVQVDDALYAIDGICSHQGAQLQNAKLDGETLVCHFHGSGFNVKTGTVVNGPASKPLQTYEVSLGDDQLLIGGIPAYVRVGYTGLVDSG